MRSRRGLRRRKRWACSHRDCERVFDIDGVSSSAGVPKKGICPDHPTARVRKVRAACRQIASQWPTIKPRKSVLKKPEE